MLTVIGHRGMGSNPNRDANDYPENTLSSFEAAIACGVDGIEFDVQVVFDRGIKDGPNSRVIVMHDDSVDRTTNGKGLVREIDFADIRKLDAGKGQIVPMLEEVLNLVDRRAVCNIEMKGVGIAEPVARIMQRYISEKGWRNNDFLISSFSVSELKAFRDLMPSAMLGLLINDDEGWLENCRKIGAYSVNPNKKVVNADFVKKAHENGLKVFAWTVNSIVGINKMKILGIDGIFTDFSEEAMSRIS